MSGFDAFMSGWGWVIFSLISALILVISYVTNQYMRLPGHLLVFWSRVLTVLALTPLMLHMAWPRDPLFYIAVLLTIPTGVFADIRTLNVSASYGGGVVSRTMPLVILLSFFAWFFFDPALLGKYAAQPVHSLLILLALTGCVYFSSRLNKCSISRAAAVEMLPALLGYTASTVFNKLAMSHGAVTSAVFCYMYLQSIVAVPVIGGYVFWRESRTKVTPVFWRTRKMMLATFLLTFSWIGNMTFKNYAMAFVPNPSFQSALGQTTPVFIALFYWFVKHKEKADVASGMGVAACATLLALMTAGK